ncbi:hypothetical protein A2627_00140 [Candidatus Woesebacteria bacterium RIFCSPHIGHO2_01_FULL_39_28]|uniref:Type II secretion system protein GspG C-terminal domain-containing protein n=1 Tax=Candidatus Woesebacteria bacterium RIFCSPHIGHO2_01_FULL_39_28 TaxID=1802496 RepID=A0A1F7YF92_9BACT|nr:MAG: hypothetical protein A2627_00140 [Candidatus Woesebacteria bacterium RIFCSPHIGHO2_01_FULL_39_28]OGM57880.1 MAG: hypothetical protein A3A50_04570 [Candidatus Woesebacteria bacterium RIFCSPLOWO2_01_FULL_38_20]
MKKGFTLIELLVTMSIISIIVALSLFALSGSKDQARDGKRKSDLEFIRSGLEMYRSDCGSYPAPAGGSVPSPLTGSCGSSATYINSVPADPQSPARIYLYARPSATTYELCASLEQGSGSVSCGGSSNCGTTCNYKVTNP